MLYSCFIMVYKVYFFISLPPGKIFYTLPPSKWHFFIKNLGTLDIAVFLIFLPVEDILILYNPRFF